MRWRRPVLEAIFVLTETIAWFTAIAVVATVLERTFLTDVEQRIRSAIATRGLPEPEQARIVADELARASGGDAGPSFLLVAAAAAGGFIVMRLVQRVDFGAALGSVILLASTIIGVNILVHLTMGNLMIWDTSELVGLVNSPNEQLARGIDLEAFVRDPDVQGPHGPALGGTFIGLMLVWFRFMLAARKDIGIDRMARSFTVSFVVVLFVLFAAAAGDVAAPARWAVPQFVLGMLGLAIGNHERALPSKEASARATPWMTSVGGTLGLLVVSAVILGMLAYLDVGAVLGGVGTVALSIIEVLLIIIITPIYWVLNGIFSWFFGGVELELPPLPEFAFGEGEPPPAEEQEEGGFSPPDFLVNSLKFFAVAGILYVMYLVGRLLVGRREGPPAPIDETRARGTGGAGFGRLLADLVSFRRPRDPNAWMSRHNAYRLYGRAVADADDRGLRAMEAETPLEFAAAARHHLEAHPFERVAEIFEQARYGRHYPSDETLREAARDLEAWEEAHPATEELRARVRGARPLAEDEEIAMRIAMAKQATLRRNDEDAQLSQ
ncbi:MAG: DUF4129 domain-containing protein [Dehalococcoidia bacterium]